MANTITGIDHVRIGAADLSVAAAALARLGFAVAPDHRVSFGGSHLELIAGGGGLTGAALGAPDADKACAALRLSGIAAEMPGGGVVTWPADATPGLPSFLCQPVAGEAVHANGATGIASVTVLLARPGAHMNAYNKMFGAAACTPTDDMVTVHTGGGLIYLVTPDGFDHLHPDIMIDLPAAPALAAIAIRVPDLGRAADALTANGVAFRRKSGNIAVSPKDALGIGLEFIEG